MNLAQKIRWAGLKASINIYKLTMDASYPKDPNPENWRTIQGAKVHLSEGKIDGGAGGKFHGKSWTGKKAHNWSQGRNSVQTQSQLFTHKQGNINEGLKAIQKAPAGTVINYFSAGFGSNSQGQYKIVEAGGGKKKLAKLNENGQHERMYMLTPGNIKKYLGGSINLEITPPAQSKAEGSRQSLSDAYKKVETAKTEKDAKENYKSFIKNDYNNASAQELSDYYSKNPPETLKNKSALSEKREKEVERQKKRLHDLGINDDQIAQLEGHLKKVIDNNAYGMRINQKHFENVVDDWFKNQFETNTSEGWLDQKERAKSASVLFADNDLKKNIEKDGFKREKYGMAVPKDVKTFYTNGDHYGDAVVRFKKDRLKGRVTYTLGDSLELSDNKDFVAGDADNPSLAGTNAGISTFHLMGKGKSTSLNSITSRYLEYQYHGPLTITDVESVVFDERHPMPPNDTLKKMKNIGIKLYLKTKNDDVIPFD